MTGHLLGGAGGLEAGISVLALRDQIAAADDQSGNSGSGVRSRLRAESHAQAAVEYALSNSFGFGGTNAALLFKRWDPARTRQTTISLPREAKSRFNLGKVREMLARPERE